MNIFFILALICITPFLFFMVVGLSMAGVYVWENLPSAIRSWWREVKKEIGRRDFEGFLEAIFPAAALMALGAMLLVLTGLIFEAEKARFTAPLASTPPNIFLMTLP